MSKEQAPAQTSVPTSAPATKATDLAESLWPSPVGWLGFAVFGAAFGLIPGPIDATFAIGTAVVTAGVVLGLVVLWTPKLVLVEGVFSAGRAKVPVALIARVEPLDAGQMKAALGAQLDGRAYRSTRPWVKTGIRITLDDPQDPTPYWLLSSRRPQAWVRALGS